ncbi:expressed protein [Chlorella variabilis]|uniref:Expressed protein n=1 Tax=Chlorella variabilis TaxID=554065 RepID=E1Z4H9_CHLVA|nr:expressed protein [Chlorella variabilis]EFN59064.1 expressed protein [Chlorella variabilis]|eukprot:XP_005851166.1 expressed protein [Chlorella variabilis]
MALLESFRRADIKAQQSFKDAKTGHELSQSVFQDVYVGVTSGALKVHTAVAGGAEQVANFFKGLVGGSSKSAGPSIPAELVTPEGSHPDLAVSMQPKEVDAPRSTSNVSASSASTAWTDGEHPPSKLERESGTYRVDYQKYPIAGYVKLPYALQPFVQLPYLDHVVVVAKPSGDVSGGLENYRESVSKPERAAAPIFAVIDTPGKVVKDKGYLWIEIPLSDIFKLNVGEMKGVEDYMKVLSKKGRWNYKDRQKKFKQGLTCEHVPLPPGSKELVDELWPLYKNTGERNGFTVLTEAEFYDFHLTTPDLTVMLIRDKDSGGLVTFCTGVRAGDTLMPMWCGTDYDNEKSRQCSSYFNMLYEYVKIGIADPTINWIDLGASRRSAKVAIGFTGYPVSIYIRCKNSVQESLYSQMMATYFKKEELINDP